MSVQSLDHGLELLRLLAAAGQHGLRPADLQRRMGLGRSTIHRLLSTLRNQGFVDLTERDARYCIGSETAALGWAFAKGRHDLKEQCGDDIAGLAAATGESSFLVVRVGYETICIDRRAGACHEQDLFADDEARKPIGTAAAGVAMLATMPEKGAAQTLRKVEPMLSGYPLSIEGIRVAMSAARRDGYAFGESLMLKGMRGLAMPVRNGQGEVVGSAGLLARTDDLPQSRLPGLISTLKIRVSHMEEQIAFHEEMQARYGAPHMPYGSRGW